MPAMASDIVVIGGGVIGLSVAYRLAQGGARVTVIDGGHPGQASTAAAGMLAPLAESNALPALAELGIPSLRQYPEFVAELADASGLPLCLNGPGIVRIAMTEREAVDLCASVDRQSQSGFPVHLLSREETLGLEPSLSADVILSVLSPAERHITPILLLQSLTLACERIGVRIVVDTATNVSPSGSGWTVTGKTAVLECDAIVVSGGAWTAGILQPLGIDLPISPLKGQILSVRFPKDTPSDFGHDYYRDGQSAAPFIHTIYAHSTYIVPRPSGEVIIGATEEPESGFNIDSTHQALNALRSRSQRLIPALAAAGLTKATVGLRPASPDRLPLIGKLPGLANAYVASGHGRNGILLTPKTADLVRDIVLNGATPPESVDPARKRDV